MLCGHLFCTSCLCSWLSTANSCPTCRYELPTDNETFEGGRLERMRGRKACLKHGELRMMPLCDLKCLMSVLDIPTTNCTDKQALLRRLESHPDVQVLKDSDVRYSQADLANLDADALAALLERHIFPSLGRDLQIPDRNLRDEVQRRFAANGLWVNDEKQRPQHRWTHRAQAAVKTWGSRTSDAPSSKSSSSSAALSIPGTSAASTSAELAAVSGRLQGKRDSWPARMEMMEALESEADMVAVKSSERKAGQSSVFQRPSRIV